jgi:hypothetical protein
LAKNGQFWMLLLFTLFVTQIYDTYDQQFAQYFSQQSRAWETFSDSLRATSASVNSILVSIKQTAAMTMAATSSNTVGCGCGAR